KAFPLGDILSATALVAVIVIIARFAWVYPATYLPRLINPRLRARDPMPSWRTVFVIAFTGVRGAVSLAAALALPFALPNGEAFPHRDLILFVSFGVIFITLVGLGLSLPPVVRWLGVAQFGPDAHDVSAAGTELTRELISAERKFIHTLLRDGRITDEIRRRIERDLDLEE